MKPPDVEVAVVGAGIAGLAAAATLRRAGRDVVVLEAGTRAGGAAWSERIDGHLVERGANTFRISAAMAAFLRAHDLDDRVVPASPASRERFLVRSGRLVAVPNGPLAFAASPLLSMRGKLRLLAEPLLRRGDAAGESVAEFAARRFGRETCDALIGPFLTGVYAGDEAQLGAESVFPSLVAAERGSGSVLRGLAKGVLAGRDGGRAGSWSARDGCGGLAEALAGSLAGALRFGARVSRITFEEPTHRIEIEGDSGIQVLRSEALILAAPAREAGAALTGLDDDTAKALGQIATAPIACVALSIARGATRVPVRGFGFLVPRGEGRPLLGCLFSSQLFADRAPPERELLTLLAGGTRAPEALDWPDERLVGALVDELDRVLGLRETPRVLAITRWSRAVPQPGRDHPRLVSAVRDRLARFPRLALAGAHLDGVAFGDALASGVRAARQVTEYA